MSETVNLPAKIEIVHGNSEMQIAAMAAETNDARIWEVTRANIINGIEEQQRECAEKLIPLAKRLTKTRAELTKVGKKQTDDYLANTPQAVKAIVDGFAALGAVIKPSLEFEGIVEDTNKNNLDIIMSLRLTKEGAINARYTSSGDVIELTITVPANEELIALKVQEKDILAAISTLNIAACEADKLMEKMDRFDITVKGALAARYLSNADRDIADSLVESFTKHSGQSIVDAINKARIKL